MTLLLPMFETKQWMNRTERRHAKLIVGIFRGMGLLGPFIFIYIVNMAFNLTKDKFDFYTNYQVF